MDSAEFDRVAEEYATLLKNNISASGESPEFFARYKILDTAEFAKANNIPVHDILDFGSGIGNSLPYFSELFPNSSITAADVSVRSMEISQLRFPSINAKYVDISSARLPFQDESFDLCFSACVFHHIPADEHIQWLSELHRVTKKNGLLVIFEHNPLNPLTVSAVQNCEFDENAVLIPSKEFEDRVRCGGWSKPATTFRIFFPRIFAFARPLERWLKKLPLGAQYFVSARRD